jgi:hypothetical protein
MKQTPMPHPSPPTGHFSGRRSAPALIAALGALSLAIGCAGTPAVSPVAGTPTTKTYGLRIDNGAVGRPPANGKTLLAIYMIGSDLEDDLRPRNGTSDEEEFGTPVKTGNGTLNLKQLIAGYAALSDAEKANVEVLVAMGGARKQSWKGIKYLDLAALTADGTDDFFGNDGPFLHADATADMSAQGTFEDFLKRVQARAPGAGKVMVELWSHGGAYMGVGPDTNHVAASAPGMLSLDEIQGALVKTGFKADVVGFDACLMGNLEVAERVKNHFDYMVASEENEPSHGWDYSLIVQAMGRTPMASALDFGKRIVDIYIESPANQKSKARTLSVVDLGKTAAVTASLDALSASLIGDLDPSFQPLLNAAGGSQSYGRHSDAGTEFTLDLRDFTDRLGASGGLGGPSGQVVSAVQNMVAYARESGEKPHSNGLSIFSPINTTFFESGYYSGAIAVSPRWYDFVDSFIDKAKGATSGPVVSGETPIGGANPAAAAWRSLLAFQAPTLGEVPDGSFSMAISANPGVARVSAMHVVQPDPSKNRFRIVSGDRVEAGPDGRYTLAGWDGMAMHLTDGQGVNLLAPITFETLSAAGTSVYMLPARVNGEEATIYLEWDAAKGAAVSQWVVPFQPSTGTRAAAMSKRQSDLVAGDTVSLYTSTIDTDADAKTAELSAPVTLGAAPIWRQAPVAGQKLYFLFAQDLKGQVTASPLHLVVDLLGDAGL